MRGRRDTTVILLGLATAGRYVSTATGLYCAAACRYVTSATYSSHMVLALRAAPWLKEQEHAIPPSVAIRRTAVLAVLIAASLCTGKWQPGQARIAAGGGADRRSAKIAAAPMDQSREALLAAGRTTPPGGPDLDR
jgi:hypothetical protein